MSNESTKKSKKKKVIKSKEKQKRAKVESQDDDDDFDNINITVKTSTELSTEGLRKFDPRMIDENESEFQEFKNKILSDSINNHQIQKIRPFISSEWIQWIKEI
jgi:hypothetical protein